MSMLVAYRADGTIIATLGQKIVHENGVPRMLDFDAIEGELSEVWNVPGAKGSKVWHEDLGGKAHRYRVELDGPDGGKHIAALVHRETGERRER